MRCLLFILCCLLSGCMSSALSGANVVYKHKYLQDQVADYSITIRCWNALKQTFCHDDIKHLHLTSFNRIVLLTGQLPDNTVRCGVENLLRNTSNIARIFNATTIETPITGKQQLQDSWLTTKVKSKIITSNEIYADKIKVVTENDIVYLMGIVTEEEGNVATALAKETQGVKKVVTIFYYMTMPSI